VFVVELLTCLRGKRRTFNGIDFTASPFGVKPVDGNVWIISEHGFAAEILRICSLVQSLLLHLGTEMMHSRL